MNIACVIATQWGPARSSFRRVLRMYQHEEYSDRVQDPSYHHLYECVRAIVTKGHYMSSSLPRSLYVCATPCHWSCELTVCVCELGDTWCSHVNLLLLRLEMMWLSHDLVTFIVVHVCTRGHACTYVCCIQLVQVLSVLNLAIWQETFNAHHQTYKTRFYEVVVTRTSCKQVLILHLSS